MSRSQNGCVVLTAPLASAIRSFLDRWENDRPWSDDLVSGMEWLSNESGLSEDSIWAVRRGRHATTGLSIADALVNALGHPEWFYDGTLKVVPNPYASRALREECCGGSVPPSLLRGLAGVVDAGVAS